MRRLVLALLRRLTDDSLADSILGDLDELRHTRAARGPRRAALWFWREAAAIVLHATAQRAREAVRSAADWRPTTGRMTGDLRYAVRSLRCAPWYSATVIGVMAVGIGLAATVFAVVDGVLFKPLPYPDADRLVSIQPGFSDPGARGRPPVSPNELDAWLLAASAAVGVAIASPVLAVTMALLPHELHLLKTPAIDARAIAFTVLMLAVSVALTTIWPVRRALRASVWWSANEASAATPRTRSFGRAAVVAGQTAGTLVLVVTGALLVGSLLQVWSNDSGLDAQDLVVADLVITPDGSSGFGESEPGVAARFDRFLEGARRLPGVTAAGGADVLMLSRSWWGVVGFKPVGATRGSTENVQGIPVTPGFFQAAGPRAVEGRLPSDAELAAGAPVAVVGRAFAAGHWPGEPALGRQLLTSVGQRALPPHTIVGVVDDVRFAGWDLDPEAAVYAPYATLNFGGAPVAFIRPAGDNAAVVREVLRLAEREGPGLRVRRAATAGTLLAETVRPRRLRSWLFGAFAAASLALVGVGLFGLAAMSIARRTREIGVRLALGATRERLVRGLVVEQFAPVAAGLAIGALLAAWAVRYLQTYLYEITIYDARVWLAALLVVAGTALAGTLVPSWRASRIDPMRALRTE